MRPIPPGGSALTRDLLFIGDVILYAGLPAMILFFILYALRSRWNATSEGRALLFLSGSVTLVGCSVAASLFFGSGYPGQPFVRMVAYSAFSASSWWLFITLVRAQNRRDDAAGLPRETRTFSE